MGNFAVFDGEAEVPLGGIEPRPRPIYLLFATDAVDFEMPARVVCWHSDFSVAAQHADQATTVCRRLCAERKAIYQHYQPLFKPSTPNGSFAVLERAIQGQTGAVEASLAKEAAETERAAAEQDELQHQRHLALVALKNPLDPAWEYDNNETNYHVEEVQPWT